MRVDRQPPTLTEIEHVLMVQVAVQRAERLRSSEELARNSRGRCKQRVLRGELEERLEPGIQRVQLRKWTIPRGMQPSGCVAKDPAGVVILTRPSHLREIAGARASLHEQGIALVG